METLEYYGKSLKVEPVNTTREKIVLALDNLLALSVSVILEPGDATRYEFILTPLKGVQGEVCGWDPRYEDKHLLVTRLRGGYPTGSTILWDGCYLPEQVDPLLANGPAVRRWERELFTWWFEQLFAWRNAA
jgi:hypothetical protein